MTDDSAEKELEKRRQEARLAMEGVKHRASRETKERINREAAANKLKLVEDLEKARQQAFVAEQAKREAEQAVETKTNQEREIRLNKVRSSQAAVEALTKSELTNLPPIRTLKTDLANLTKSDNWSVEKIIVTEKKRNQRTLLKEAGSIFFQWRDRWLIGGLISVVIFIFAGSGYFLFRSAPAASTVQPLTVPAIITPDERREFNLTGQSPEKIALILSQQHELIPTAEDAVVQFYFVSGGGPTRQLISFSNLAEKASLALPLSFTQAISLDFMVGLYRSREPAAFYLFAANIADSLRATMLANERKIIGELFRPLAGPETIAQVETARIRDSILNNIDVRILENERGQTIFVYGLIADKLLVITENETTFSKIFRAYRP